MDKFFHYMELGSELAALLIVSCVFASSAIYGILFLLGAVK